MRSCPKWFQDALTQIGGTNVYSEPIFRLVWSTTERMIIGGLWANGFAGYKSAPAITGVPCWALMVWEPREMQGDPVMWDYMRDPDTNMLELGGYPKYGKYRLLRRFTHQEITQSAEYRQVWKGRELHNEQVQVQKLETYRMEPCGLMLDLMLPMLIRWRKLSDERKREILLEKEQQKKDEFLAKAKDIRHGCKISKGSAMVAKRAALIEKGMAQAMKMAAGTGLGMRIGA